jgi:hypothetical protein
MIRAGLVHEGASCPKEKGFLLPGTGDDQERADELSPKGTITDAPRLQKALDRGEYVGVVLVEQRPKCLTSLLSRCCIDDAVVDVEADVRS